jgi:hypothetical protein
VVAPAGATGSKELDASSPIGNVFLFAECISGAQCMYMSVIITIQRVKYLTKYGIWQVSG